MTSQTQKLIEDTVHKDRVWRGRQLCLMASALIAANLSAHGQTAQPNASFTQSAPLAIGVGDVVSVAVFDTPSLSFQDRVDDAGNVKAPVLGPIHIAGMTAENAAHTIEDQLRSGNIMKTPSVTVQDTEYATQGVTVLGQVHNPGTYTLLGPHNLYDALSSAGGVTDVSGRSITVTHHGDSDHPEVIPVNSPDFSELQRTTRIYPGDTVFVSKADVVYVIGDVGRSGAFYMQDGRDLTVLNVLSLAGGDNATSTDKKSSIVRTTSGGVVTIPVNVHEIKRNKAPDIALLPNDILVIPRSASKVFFQAVLPGVALAGTSSAVSAALIR